MPELPEVEVVRLGLDRWAVGSTIAQVEVLHPRPVRRHLGGAGEFAALATGAAIAGTARRGKFCWLVLDGDAADPNPGSASRTDRALSDGTRALLIHLGMSGQMLLQPPEAADEKHLRVRLHLTGGRESRAGRELRFVDQRMFGGLTITPLVPVDSELVPDLAAHIARDLLDPGLDVERLITRLRTRRTAIKRALLDQTLVSGIGNIYADEGLFRAGLHGERPCERLSRPALRRLMVATAAVMTEALAQGGTSFDSLYVNVNGSSGYFERALSVYGREGQGCRLCGTPIRRSHFMNRSSFWCPRCQPEPRTAG